MKAVVRGFDALMMLALMPSMLTVGGGLVAEDIGSDDLLEEFVRAFALAELRGDTDFFERALTTDFLAIGPRGFKLTRDQWIDRHRSGDLKNEAVTWNRLRVRSYGDAAMITGCLTQRGVYKGHGIDGAFRVTLAAVLIATEWRIAGLHLSPLSA